MIVIGHGHVPPLGDGYLDGQGQIDLLLQVFVVGRQQFVVVVPVVGIVVGVLDEHACLPAVPPAVLPLPLHEARTRQKRGFCR